MGLSKDGSIGFALAAILGIALVLIRPEQAAWRLVLLVCFGMCMVYVAKEVDWVKQRNVELSIVHGASVSESRSAIRLGFALLVATLLSVVFGVATWPPHREKTSEATVLTSGFMTATQPNIETSKPALLPLPQAKAQPPAAIVKPPKIKAVAPQPEPYPIIVVSGTQFTNKADANQFDLLILLANETSTEVNAHIVLTTFVSSGGVETQTGFSDERDIGFAPPPFIYQLSTQITTTADGQKNYTAGNAFLVVVVTVSYPDSGGRTIYHFKGKTDLRLPQLDYLKSDWERIEK